VITIYGIGSCDSCRATRRWFAERDIETLFHDLRTDGLDRKMLARWAAAHGWEALLNRRSITWRKIPEVDRSGLTESRAIRLMLEYPTLVRRPVVESAGQVVVGVSETAFAQLEKAS
jgi:arsenate reductase